MHHAMPHPSTPSPVERRIRLSMLLPRQRSGVQYSTTAALAHLVLARILHLPSHVLRLHLIINHNIQISSVIVVGLAAQHALHTLPSLYGKHILQIEYCLLPVRVLGVRTRTEAHRLVAGGELDVEPGDQRMDVVGAADGHGEGEFEGEVGGCAGVEVEGYDGCRVGDDGFELDGVDEGFGESGGFEGRVVEAVDVVPD